MAAHIAHMSPSANPEPALSPTAHLLSLLTASAVAIPAVDLTTTSLQVGPSPDACLAGDATMARYLARVHHLYGADALQASQIDQWADLAFAGRLSSAQAHDALNEYLAMRTFMVGAQWSLADAAVYVHLGGKPAPGLQHLSRWLAMCDATACFPDTMAAVDAKRKAARKSAEKKLATKLPVLEGNPDPRDVCTRFPPEPSGHLHIGHAKAIFLNQYYAKEYLGGGGRLLVRFDDTNPANEKEEYEAAILQDLAALQIRPDQISHTSDHFDRIIQEGAKMIANGLAYCDVSSQEEMALQRGRATGVRVASPYRDNSVEENTRLWALMLKGEMADVAVGGDKKDKRSIVLRAKVTDDHGTPGYLCGNGSMRDPVLFRVIADVPHAKTGAKYKAYPTYDMACPIVDSIEGVTHVLRDSQYSDREEQFNWLQKAMGLRTCYIQPFSRVNFKRTVMSKRRLAALIDEGFADGWSDPRFPTVKGMMRRGLAVESLRAFMVALGASTKPADMEWDKIWSDNMRFLDPTAHRYMAVAVDSKATMRLVNFAEAHPGSGPDAPVVLTVPLLPKDPSKGTKPVFAAPDMFVERSDLEGVAEGALVGLMRYSVVQITAVRKDALGAVLGVDARIVGQDFRSAERLITWVSASPYEMEVETWEHDFILHEGAEDDEPPAAGAAGGEEDPGAASSAKSSSSDWRRYINRQSAASLTLIANAAVRVLQKSQVIQIERRGLYIVDRPFTRPGEKMQLIKIPDGKQRAMSTVTGALTHR